MKEFLRNVFLYFRSYPYSDYRIYYEVNFKDIYENDRTVLVTKKRFVKQYKNFQDFSCKRRVIWKINW